MQADPMSQSKDELASIVSHISVPNPPVGIDAQRTHAIIIAYLQADREPARASREGIGSIMPLMRLRRS